MKWRGRQIEQQVKDKLNDNIGGTLNFLERYIKKSISKPKSGTKYPGMQVASSKAGEPPASQTGTLMRSITTEQDKQNIAGIVGTNVKYGKWLELGTKNIKPRPFLRPSIEENKIKIRDMITEDI